MIVLRSRGCAWGLALALGCSPQSDPAPTLSGSIAAETAPPDTSVNVPAHVAAAPPKVSNPLGLRVVYPGPTDVVRVQDSSFLFGSVADAKASLTINGAPIRVWPNGAWLAWVPFPPDTLMNFRLEASTAADTSVLIHRVRRHPSTLPGEVRAGEAWLDSVSLTPQGQVWLPRDEYLPLSVRAAPGSHVRVRLPDGGHIRLQPQREWREVSPALRGFERDTSKLRVPNEIRYMGSIRGRAIGPDPGPVLRNLSAPLVRALARAALRCVAGLPCPARYEELLGPETSWATVEAIFKGDTARSRWPLQVALLDTLPLIARLDDDTVGGVVTDSLTPGRAAPAGTYVWFFPTGTRAAVTGRVNDDVRIRLSPVSEAWVPAAEARPLAPGLPVPQATVGSVLVTAAPDRITLRIPLTTRVPFQVTEDDRRLELKLYSAAGDVEWIRYAKDSLIERLAWSQTARGEVTLTIDLSSPVWGYRTRWSRNDLLLDIRRPPGIRLDHPLRDRVIAVDPGHPPLGATGPTGLREAEANLAVAIQLQAMLRAAGARVVMTRTGDTPVELWQRLARAEAGDAELLVSIHNDALPDGINPFTNHGTAVFYNQPRSLPLAAQVQRSIVARLQLPDRGVSRADLAVVRGTWMPSVLVEGMFMIMPEQEAALRTPAGARRYARGVYEGIRRFLLERARGGLAGGVGRPGAVASPRATPSPSNHGTDAGESTRGVAP